MSEQERRNGFQMRIGESQDVLVGIDLKAHQVPTPAVGWVPPPAQAAQGPSMALGTSRDGAPTALWAAAPAFLQVTCYL